MHQAPSARRVAIWLGVFLVSVVAVLVTAGPRGSVQAELDVTEPTAVREFSLVAAPVRWEIQPGLVVDSWAYNGSVPGPELRVREGDLVRVHLHNDLPVPTTIHWHGIDVPFSQDGVPGLSQEPVSPGAEYTYEFVATNPGTRWYHSHVDSNAQLELGLYGALIIEPREAEPVAYDRDFTYILDEKALDFTPDVALGRTSLQKSEAGNGRGGLLQYDLFLMNGKAGDAIVPLHIASGERIRVRLINAGNLVHAMHLHGQSFRIVATDGNPVPQAQQLLKDTVLIGPGERYDLEIDGTNPGVWMFHCHMPNHQDNGMMTTLVYDDFSVPETHSAAAPNATPSASPLPVQSTTANRQPSTPSDASAFAIRVADNHFEPADMSVPVGATVTWTNAGINRHTATDFEGTFDTGDIAPGGSKRITFTQPGTYRYFCRQHVLGGMLGTIHVG
ncbi:MAG: multicopper oxidase domain-containing protein [Chloroflexi bacterium]|nr:multicopper oxidase domain-containing protein [Chloroflexota bacterium]MBV9602435.1 multicopper oxidase domain-containing protein [Chloroflexota bacterium]